jgi:hypothetical protein
MAAPAGVALLQLLPPRLRTIMVSAPIVPIIVVNIAT